MGGAFCGIVDNAYTNFYNSAGLAFQKEFDLSYECNSVPWAINADHWTITGVLPLNKNLSSGFFGSGIYDKSIDLIGGDTLTTTFYQFCPGLALGYKLLDLLGLGVNVKYIQSSFTLNLKGSNYNSWTIGRAFATDIGLLVKYPLLLGKAGFGFTVQNIGPAMAYTASYPTSGIKDPLPITIRAGVSYSISVQDVNKSNPKEWLSDWFKDKWRLLVAYDINKVKDEKFWHSFGLELRPIPILSLRFGYFNAPEPNGYEGRKGWVSGFGVDLKFLRLDISDDSAQYFFKTNRLRFSLSLNIGEPIFPKNGLLGKK